MSNVDPSKTVMTGTRQTMMTWAKVVEALDEVPAAFREACHQVVGDRPVFPYVVYAPTLGGTRHRVSDSVLCDVDDTLFIVQRTGRQLTTTGYPWAGIRDLEYGNSLLYSWITVWGQTAQGVSSTTTVVFNLSTARYFRPLIGKARTAPPPADGPVQLDEVAGASFKFVNFARESLRPGEWVREAVWQPAIRQRIAGVLGWSFYRTVSLAHLTVLTDREVILIRDDEESARKGKARYGGVWRYVPLRHVVSTAIGETPEGFLTLSLGLTANGRIERVFAADRRAELEGFQGALEALIKRQAA